MGQFGTGKRDHLLVKRGLYYAPNSNGYTGIKERAGRYREIDALGLEGVTAIHEDEAPEFAPACWQETKEQHLRDKIAERDATIARIQRGWADFLPRNLNIHNRNIPVEIEVPLLATFGELRALDRIINPPVTEGKESK